MHVRTKMCLLAGLLLAAATCMAFAANPRAMRKQVEASMLVTGRITIERDGSVGGWTLDQRDKLPEIVTRLIDGNVPQWKFEPVLIDGKPVRGDARMSLRLVATRAPGDSGDYTIAIRDGYFGRDALDYEQRDALGLKDEFVISENMLPPRYPVRALQANVQGTVYLVLRVNRQGAVDEVVAEQVNLRTLGSEQEMARMRTLLTGPAVAAARGWKFKAPTAGESAGDTSWTLRVPVTYRIGDASLTGYGEWEAYVPGPRAPVPWRDARDGGAVSPDTLIAGEVYQAGAALKLLTPING